MNPSTPGTARGPVSLDSTPQTPRQRLSVPLPVEGGQQQRKPRLRHAPLPIYAVSTRQLSPCMDATGHLAHGQTTASADSGAVATPATDTLFLRLSHSFQVLLPKTRRGEGVHDRQSIASQDSSGQRRRGPDAAGATLVSPHRRKQARAFSGWEGGQRGP